MKKKLHLDSDCFVMCYINYNVYVNLRICIVLIDMTSLF